MSSYGTCAKPPTTTTARRATSDDASAKGTATSVAGVDLVHRGVAALLLLPLLLLLLLPGLPVLPLLLLALVPLVLELSVESLGATALQ